MTSSEGEDPKESKETRVERFLKNWRHEKFSFLSSSASFDWLKGRFATDNVKYVLTDINDPQQAYQAVKESFEPERSVNAVSFSNIIDVELSEGRSTVSGVFILNDGDVARQQSGYLSRLRKHVRDIENNLSTKGGLSVSSTRLLLESSGQSRYNHIVEGLSAAVGALSGNGGIHITDDVFEMPEGDFWQGVSSKQEGKINYDQGDIQRARELSRESSGAAMKLSKAKNAKDLGGIDFSQINYDLKLDAEGVPLFDTDWQHMSTDIQGLVPVIYDIAPVGVSDVFAFAQR